MIAWGRNTPILTEVTSHDTKNVKSTTSQFSPTSSMVLVNFKLLFCMCSQFVLTLTNPLAPNPVKLSIVNCSLSSRCDVKFFSIPLPSSTSGGQFSTGRHSNHLVELSTKAQTRMAATSLNWSGNEAWKCNVKERPLFRAVLSPSPDFSSLPAGLGWRRGARARQRQHQPCCRLSLWTSCLIAQLFSVFVFWYQLCVNRQRQRHPCCKPSLRETDFGPLARCSVFATNRHSAAFIRVFLSPRRPE